MCEVGGRRLLKSGYCGKHCHLGNFEVWVFIGLSPPICKVFVMHWPNGIYSSPVRDLRLVCIRKFNRDEGGGNGEASEGKESKGRGREEG